MRPRNKRLRDESKRGSAKYKSGNSVKKEREDQCTLSIPMQSKQFSTKAHQAIHRQGQSVGVLLVVMEDPWLSCFLELLVQAPT